MIRWRNGNSKQENGQNSDFFDWLRTRLFPLKTAYFRLVDEIDAIAAAQAAIAAQTALVTSTQATIVSASAAWATASAVLGTPANSTPPEVTASLAG